MTKIIERCTLCSKVLKTDSEEACSEESGECEGEYEFHNDLTSDFNFCKNCREMLEQKDEGYNAWKGRHKYKYMATSGGTYKSGDL